MMSHFAPSTTSWFREPSLYVMLVLCGLIHASRLNDRPLQGEEPRRGLVACEMLWTGDWLVPTTQGQLFLSRPPLQNWLIAIGGIIRGEVDVLAIRIPSVISLLLMVAMLFGYARQWVPTYGALLAGLSYATMGQVLELGSSGETESFYTLLVAGSLLLWHWGHTAGWSPTLYWSLGYALAAAGMLTKGPQAPVYFIVAVGGYLLLTRRWQDLLTKAHLIGLFVFLTLWSAWNVPFWMQVGTESMIAMYHHDIALRYEDKTWSKFVIHLVQYPIEILGCMMPWSLMLPIYLMPGFWRVNGPQRWPDLTQVHPAILFSLCATSLCFLSVWLTTGAETRYFMPLYPSIAILISLAAVRCLETTSVEFWAGSWNRFQTGFSWVMIASAVAILAMPWIPLVCQAIPSLGYAATISTIFAALAWVTWRTRDSFLSHDKQAGVFAISGYIGVVFVGVVMNFVASAANQNAEKVSQLKANVPDDAPLVSLGEIGHVFAFHYQEPIEVLAPTDPSENLPAELEYVAFQHNEENLELLDSDWEVVDSAVLSRTNSLNGAITYSLARRVDEAN